MEEQSVISTEFVETNDTSATAVMQPPAEIKTKKQRKKRAPKHDFKDGRGRVPAHRHDNGGGWVSDSAKVDDSVYVGAHCQIYESARVRDNVRLEGRSEVRGFARVRDNVLLKNKVSVLGSARISDSAKLYDNVRVGGNARISGDTYLNDNCRVFGDASLYSVTLRGIVEVTGGGIITHSHIHGTGNEGIFIQGMPTIFNSTLYGAGTISNHAQINRATIRINYGRTAFLFTDFAIITEDAKIYAPLTIAGHVTLIGGEYRHNNVSDPAATITGTRVLHNGRFNSYDALQTFLTETNSMPPVNALNSAAATVMNPAHLLQTAENATITLAPVAMPISLAPVQRRILRADPEVN